MKDIIIDLQKSGTWKIQLSIPIKFISSEGTNDVRIMHSKSDNIEIITYDNANEVIEELFESPLFRYQIGLKTSMRGSDFIFDCVNLLYYKCRKINFKLGGSYDSPDWIKKKKINNKSKK